MDGVWTVAGGMHALARTVAALAAARGAEFSYSCTATEILLEDRKSVV